MNHFTTIEIQFQLQYIIATAVLFPVGPELTHFLDVSLDHGWGLKTTPNCIFNVTADALY